MAMSDDPRYRRGQSSNQRPPQGQDDMRGRGESRPERPARSYSQVDTPAERQGAAGGRTPSFSAYRPEAYATPEKRAPRSEWDDARSTPQRPQSPSAEAYPRPAPERASTQHDTRDPYRDRGHADPYAVPAQRDYEQEWRPSSYPDNKPSYSDTPYQDNKPSYQDSQPAYQESKFASFYDETPPEPDVQAVHDRFFAHSEPEAPQARYRGTDYGDASYEAPRAEPAYAPPPPQQRGNVGADREYNSWDSFEQAPAPASLRPYAAPAVAPAHDDDMDADFFADEDEFDNDDFHEEKKSGRTKLVAAVLVGAIVTGGGLAYLYKTSAGRSGNDGELPIVAAGVEPVKELRSDPGGRKFPASKPIQDRLGGEGEGDTAAEASTVTGGQESSGAVTTTGGTLEERINNALRDAKGTETASASPDTPRGVQTMTVNPDGSFGSGSVASDSQPIGGGNARRVRPQPASEPVVTTAANTETDAAEPATPPSRNLRPASAPQQRVAALAPQSAPQAAIPETTGGTGAFFVQIGARNDQAQALAAFNGMQQKYASVLGNYSPSVQKADLGERGIWYRLRVGPFQDKAGADKLCEDLKTAGWKQCFSVKD